MAYEQADYSGDPLEVLLRREEEDAECDVYESMLMAGQHRTKTMEVERTHGDTLGYSPAELSAMDSLH